MKIERLLLAACTMIFCASCSKWDEFKEYTDKGGITYVGKLDSVKILSGNERIKVRGLIKPDPKINEVRIFWNDMKDSLSVPLSESVKSSRIFEQVLEKPEGIVSLTVVTYDNLGNKSILVPVVGRSYGDRYQNSLNNRLISSAISGNNQATIDWMDMDMSTGPIATEIKYLATNSQEKLVRVPIKDAQNTITDISYSAKTIAYRTLFLPQPTSIDTFSTAFVTVALTRDVTSEYIKNSKNPIETIARSGRWAIPAYWQINTAAKNYRNADGVFFGGVDYEFGGPFLAMEAGWSADNMATITNGKIYQTVTLPIGLHSFEMDIPDCTSGGEFYTVAMKGDGIPNIENISSSIAYIKTNSAGTHKLSFTLTEPTTVSLGFVGTLPNKGSGDGTFWRINAVRLRHTIPLD